MYIGLLYACFYVYMFAYMYTCMYMDVYVHVCICDLFSKYIFLYSFPLLSIFLLLKYY